MRIALILLCALVLVGCGDFEDGAWVKHRVHRHIGMVSRGDVGRSYVVWVDPIAAGGNAWVRCNLLTEVQNCNGDPLPPTPTEQDAGIGTTDIAVWVLAAGMVGLGWSNYSLRQKGRA